MDFEERLTKAIERGERLGNARSEVQARRALTEEELKRLHTQYRLQLSEHIENCLQRLPGHLPGFRFESVVSERGWGAAVLRDDVAVGRGKPRSNAFSRLELVIRPFSAYHVVELLGKATVRNKEVFSRSHYQRLTEADPTSFMELVDLWILEFAELYAAQK
jgi:hypothetical protein